jgi:hypothetical protein
VGEAVTGTAAPILLPELGPLLGRLAAAEPERSRRAPGLEAVRLELVSALFERSGAARARLEAGDVAGAQAALGPGVWLELWERAIARAGDAVQGEMDRRLRRAAAESRLPARRLSALLPGEEDRRILGARLSAAGIGFESALHGLAGETVPWHDALRLAAGELESAWERLVLAADRELGVWDARAAAIRGWRRPWGPLVVSGAVLLALAIWLGLVLGGYLAVPGWFRPVAEWIWSLPWP